MTRPNKPKRDAADGESDQRLVCAKCKHANRKSRNVCSECGAHLHIVCHFCGHRNERIAAHCVACGKRLHGTLWRRIEKTIFRGSTKLQTWQIVLLVISVYVGYKIIIKVVELFSRPIEE